jgi:DNA-directed RNA polymerase subunit RPC12/RpoP
MTIRGERVHYDHGLEGRTMPRREYVCGECGHRFGTPEGQAVNVRTLMCPGCGSIDLTIVNGEHTPRIVMRAMEPAKAGDWQRKNGSGAS